MTGAVSMLGVALVGAFLGFILSEMGYKGARLVSIAGAVVLFMWVIGRVPDMLAELEWMSAGAGVGDAAALSMKIVGIGYIGGICYDICLDLGYRSVADAVVAVGRIEILAATVPAVSELLRMATDML